MHKGNCLMSDMFDLPKNSQWKLYMSRILSLSSEKLVLLNMLYSKLNWVPLVFFCKTWYYLQFFCKCLLKTDTFGGLFQVTTDNMQGSLTQAECHNVS